MKKMELLPSLEVSCVSDADLFDRVEGIFQSPFFFRECASWTPAADISQTGEKYIVTAEMPGIDMDSLDVSYSNGLLTIRGEKKGELFEQNETCTCSERYAGSFERSFALSGGIKEDEVDATYKDGVLRLVLPKREENRAKRIEVKH